MAAFTRGSRAMRVEWYFMPAVKDSCCNADRYEIGSRVVESIQKIVVIAMGSIRKKTGIADSLKTI